MLGGCIAAEVFLILIGLYDLSVLLIYAEDDLSSILLRWCASAWPLAAMGCAVAIFGLIMHWFGL